MTERWRDVAHLGHAELLTPDPEASLACFTALLERPPDHFPDQAARR